MTLEQLYDCSAEQLEKMTDLELIKYFEPYFSITRPERAAVAKKTPSTPVLSYDMQKRLDAVRALGIQVSARDLVTKKK